MIKASLKVTFNFSSALVLLTVSINKVRHSYLVKWLIIKSDCSRNEAAAKMLSTHHLGKGFESCVCASAYMFMLVSSVDFERRRHTQLSAFIIRPNCPGSSPLYSLRVDYHYQGFPLVHTISSWVKIVASWGPGMEWSWVLGGVTASQYKHLF